MALSTIASGKVKATKTTITHINEVLDYLAMNPDAMIRFHVSYMILNIHFDASYLSAKSTKSRASGHFFLGSVPKDGKTIILNVENFTLCTILKFLVLSAAEANVGALFMNPKEGHTILLTLAEIFHPQPQTPIHCHNATVEFIVNGTI